MLEGGFKFDTLVIGNLGNQKKDESTVKLTKYVSVNDEIIPQVKKVESYGVKILAQLIPEDAEEDVCKLIETKIK